MKYFYSPKVRRLVLLVVAGLLLVTAAGCGTGTRQTGSSAAGTVVVASKQFPEQYIVAHMVTDMLRAKTNLHVDDSKIGMGATELLMPAMEKGQIDMYPEYDGTALTVVLKHAPMHNEQAEQAYVKAQYAEKYHMAWLPPFGFEDGFAIVVRTSTAQRLHLKTLSDAAKYPNLVFGGDDTTFTRPDQYPGLQKVYGFHNTTKKVMDTDFFYQALMSKQVDIIPGFTTDPQLKKLPVTVLQDNKHFFPPYYCDLVVRQQTLDKYPQILTALKPLFGAISTRDMIDLNYEVVYGHKDPATVARDFLKQKGLLP